MNDLCIFERDGKALVNSRDVARKAGKQPSHILRDIDNTLKNITDPNLDWFIPAPYIDEKGEERRSFDITKDGFTLIAMGWSGSQWISRKVAYIQEFNRMEAELTNRDQTNLAGVRRELNELKALMATFARSGPPISVDDVTVSELLDEAGCRIHGRNKINRKTGYWLRKFIPAERWTRRGGINGPWAFPRSLAKQFMRNFGNDWVRSHNAGMRPTEVDLRQGTLKFSDATKAENQIP